MSSSKKSAIDNDIKIVSRLWSNKDDVFGSDEESVQDSDAPGFTKVISMSHKNHLMKKYLPVKNASAYHTHSMGDSHSIAP